MTNYWEQPGYRPPPPPPPPLPPGRATAGVSPTLTLVIVGLTILAGLYVLRTSIAWNARGCTTTESVILAVIEGSPGAFERCDVDDTTGGI